VLVDAKPPSIVKKFAIAGFLFAEIYMVFTVASPRLKGVDIPTSAIAVRVAAMAVLFGPFGLAVGTGVGLLVDGALRKFRGTRQKPDPTNTP
jgi:hypothetical protein